MARTGEKLREKRSRLFFGQSRVLANDSCRYKYHEEKLGDIKAARHLIIEQFVAGGRSGGGADSLLLHLRNNDAPKQTVGSRRGRRLSAEAGILRKTSEARWQEHSARENPV